MILALITLRSGGEEISEASIAEYKYELKGIEVSVASARVANQQAGMGEEFKEEGFYPVIIENPPKDFSYFNGWDIHGYETGECYGYVIDLENIDEATTRRGYDYKKYQSFESDKTITFGKDGKDNDVYIYDATGKVYYAKGYYVEDGVYYSDLITKEGPIIDVQKEFDETNNVVNLTISVEAIKNDDDIELSINGEEISKSADGTYKYEATKNDVYIVNAEEGLERISTKKVTVTEIKEEKYIITYHFNDGATPNQTQEKIASKIIRIVPPVKVTRDGYTLKGFSESESATIAEYKLGQIYSENRDLDLYAVWEEKAPEKYTIRFSANGGKNAPASMTKTEGEPTRLPSATPTREGYNFKEWNESSTETSEVGYVPGEQYAEEGNVVLYAIWETKASKLEIKVEPSSDAGNVAGQGDKKAGNYAYISASASEGYIFERWSIEENSEETKIENVYSEKTRLLMPNGTVSLIAKFKEAEYDYTIKYNSNNGTGAPNTQYKKKDQEITISDKIPTRNGYTFKGWTDTLSDNSVKYNPLDKYSDNKNITLYAIWEKNESKKYEIIFDANGGQIVGDGASKTTRYIMHGEKLNDMELGIPEAQKEGSYFAGWFTEKENGVKISESQIADKTIDGLVLYAQWSAKLHTITVEKTGNGSIVPDGASVADGKNMEFVIIPNTNYEISDVKVDGVSVLNDLTADGKYTFTNVTQNHIMSATFKHVSITVTFDGNGGTPSETSRSYEYGTTKYGTLPTATRSGYTFKGWYTATSGGSEITATGNVNIVSNHTLYAMWQSDNSAPDIPTISVSSKTTNSITFDIYGFDPDGDSLTYKIYLTDPFGNTKTYSTTSSNKTVSGLSEYTTYEYYVEAIDPSGLSETSVINNVTTYCPGTGCTGTIEYSECSECGHYAHVDPCEDTCLEYCSCDGGSISTLCPDCRGDLVIEDYYDSCEYCMDDGIRTDGSPCGWCGGDGMLDEDCRNCIEGYVYDTCPTCGGNQYYYVDCECTEITYGAGYYCSTCHNSFSATGLHCEHGSMKQHD